jgi:anthranilate synthase component 1
MDVSISFEEFARAYRAGKNQVLSVSFPCGAETPTTAYLKLCQGRPYTFILESNDGEASQGRYAIIGREPDLIWRCNADGTVHVTRGGWAA